MSKLPKTIHLLMADDDADDRQMTKEALEESRVVNEIGFVEDGEQLMDYLHHRGKYASGTIRPDLILLDLNMPRKDGREALAEIKGDPTLRQIPVVILTTSKAEEDIFRSYDLGVNSYVTKPVTFQGLVEVMRGLGCYWVQLVQLPPEHGENRK